MPICVSYLGGVYYLTPDEIFYSNETYIIQESKNSSTKSLPSLDDIQDGLFKLILFTNLDSLHLNGSPISFITKLKLTGRNVSGRIIFPQASQDDLVAFLAANEKVFNSDRQEIIKKLALEAEANRKLIIEITSN